jgi:hypothetical protein
MGETSEPQTVGGEEITLATGAKVALYRDIQPGAHAVVFTNPEGVETRIGLSDAALSALVALAVTGGRKTWVLA